MLRDRFGRVARDLRVSLTDRCTLRCSYCMPPEGLDWLPTELTLTDAEVVELCRIAVQRLGVREIRFTGGEPLLRRGLETIVAAVADLTTDQGQVPGLAMTTNGLGLAHRAQALAAAGLQRATVSLDTLDPDHFRQITHRDRLADVLAGMRAAQAAGLTPLKVNAVIMRGVNDADAGPLLDHCLAVGAELRFIEQMPIGPPTAWDRAQVVTKDDILELLSAHHELAPAASDDPSAPARLWTVDGDPTRRVGIIASVTDPFCDACDRTRVTSDGQVRSCLFATQEVDLRQILRSGQSPDQVEEQVVEAWAAAMWAKPEAHGLDTSRFAVPSRTMSRIGG